MNNELRFEVSEIIDNEIVWGRNCGSDVHVGSCFNDITIYGSLGSGSDKDEVLVKEACDFNVVRVEYARQSTTILAASHTGGLFFCSKDIETIKSHLEKVGNKEYLILYGKYT